jgi:acyclic terpene utilization AtuA family protein
VVARFDTIRLEQEGPDRVRISGVCGEPAPPTVKVCLNYLGGYRNQMTFVLTGLDIDEKAALVERTLRSALDVDQFDAFEIDLARTDKPDAVTNHEASALLKITVKSHDAKQVDRAFSSPIIEMALASYPGFFCTTPPTEASPFGVYWPTLVPANAPKHAVVLEDGTRIAVPPTGPGQDPVCVDVQPPKMPSIPAGQGG